MLDRVLLRASLPAIPRHSRWFSSRSGRVRVGLIVVALISCDRSRAHCATCSEFTTGAVNYPVVTGGGPYSVATSDFNGDGKIDLAVANINFDNVSILRGNGDGTFGAAVSYGVGDDPVSVAVGDFNGDGRPDLAVANLSSNNVSVLLRSALDTFVPAVNYPVSRPFSVAVGDVSGDGRPDLAVASQSSNAVAILLGSGTGTFAAAVNYAVGTGPLSVAIGDLNADGRTDLAVANHYSDTISVLLGNGTGTFAGAVNYGVAGAGPYSVVIGDVTGDRKPDLLAANINSNTVSMLPGNGAGTFGAAVTYATGVNPISVTAGDVSGDERLDLAVANFGSDTISILLGKADHTFAAAVSYSVGTDPISVAISDVDGDGNRDVAVANLTSNTVSILRNAYCVVSTLVATAISTSEASLTWGAVTGASSYQVFRAANGGPYSLVVSTTTPSFTDTGLAPDTTYLYQVKAVATASDVGPVSNTELATTVVFTDDPIVVGVTVPRPFHVTQLRSAVNFVRAAAGLLPATFTEVLAAGMIIKAVHVSELRSYLDAALSRVGIPAIAYTDPALTAGTSIIKAAHIQEVRSAVK